MQLLLALAMRVESLAKIADALLQLAFLQRWEREGLETAGVVVSGIVAHTHATAQFQCPNCVDR